MKTCLIIPSSYWFAPYVRLYEDILIENAIDYDIISWDRDCNNESNIISFVLKGSIKSNRIRKIIDYLRFRSFVIEQIECREFDKLVIFTPQLGLILYSYLKKNYKNRFILDYRDLSIDQFLKKRFKKVLDISALVSVSSPGFITSLPVGYNYLISHNISKEKLFNRIKYPPPFREKYIIISTIGAIRDIEANMELVYSLENHKNIKICFIGKGSDMIEKMLKNIDNVKCMGYYEKESELGLILESDFMNIYMSSDKNSSLLLSNRFYNALIHRRPMIVKSNSIQANYVERYRLGISVKNCSDLPSQIQDYVQSFDFDDFSNNCDLVLNKLRYDYSDFNNCVVNFLHST